MNSADRKQWRIAAGVKLGKWEIVREIGGGGNGKVYEVASAGKRAALKLLTTSRKFAESRFSEEIDAQIKLRDVPGIMPVIDSYKEYKGSELPPFYVMPLAKPINTLEFPQIDSEAADSERPKLVVAGILEVAKTLGSLHRAGYSHRDIKPDNILLHGSRWCLSDFGLVKRGEELNITRVAEKVGPDYIMPPEMRRNASTSDGMAADVYLLAKTLWILLTGNSKGFEGQYHDSDPSIRLLQYYGRQNAVRTLGRLISQCTDNEPKRRPKIDTVVTELGNWLSAPKDFHSTNRALWAIGLNELFPNGIPDNCSWSNLTDIVKVLNVVGRDSANCHVFHPAGGGLHFYGAEEYDKALKLLELSDNNCLFRPRRLHFYGFSDDHQWSYFFIETDPRGLLDPYDEDLATRGHRISREVTETGHGVFDDKPIEYFYDSPEYGDDAYKMRRLELVLRGNLVIFCEASAYTSDSYTYDALQNQVTRDEFGRYIDSQARKLLRGELPRVNPTETYRGYKLDKLPPTSVNNPDAPDELADW